MYRITNRSSVDGMNVTVADVLLSIPPGESADVDVAKADLAGLPPSMFDVARITKAEAEAARTQAGVAVAEHSSAQARHGADAADDALADTPAEQNGEVG